LLLLDTGLRSSELCALNLGDVDLKSGKILVRGGEAGGAKGGKGRTVYLGAAARRAVWRYLVTRDDKTDERAPLFSAGLRHLTRDALRHLVGRLGHAADVKDAHPHRFRHTFAITYLRWGGDVFTLQRLLGHGSLDMVQYYARLAQVDLEQAHRRASPVDNWQL
jgi:integrase/recombinase XerD